MDIFSKIKKFEEADYFNQNLSNVLIDEDRDKFTIDHELIDDSDYFNSNLSNVLLDTSSDIFADSFVLNDEEFDFFNQNLSNALIEDVDLDSIVDTLSLVETANEQSAVKYYKVEITKTPNNYTTATLSNGRFNGLRFKETTSTFETNAISENVVFTDSNNHDINAVVEYLNGRTESNNNSYNPSAFFVEDVSQSWGGTPWNTIEGDSNEDLVYRITFQTKIQRSDIESLTFNDINDDNVPVKFKLFVSNDLETWEQIAEKTVEYTKSLYRFDFYKKTYYKIILNSPKTETSDRWDSPGMYYPTLTDMVFDNLDFNSASDSDYTHGTAVFESEGNELNAELYIQRPAASNITVYPSDLFKRSSDGYHVSLWSYLVEESNNSYIITFKNPVELSKLDFVLNLGDYINNFNGRYFWKARRIYITLHEIDENGNVIQNLGTIYHENADFPNVQKIHVDFSMMNLDVLEVFEDSAG